MKHFRHFTMAIFVLALSGRLTKAGEIVFEPAEPMVAVGQPLQLSVTGLVNDIFWKVLFNNTGKIEGSTTSTRVTYVAPEKVGRYWITVIGKDSAGKVKSDLVGVTVLSRGDCYKHPKCGQKKAQNAKKAAIIIHANGDGSGGAIQEKTLNFMATYAYNTLKDYGHYKDEDIYYLLPNGKRKTGDVDNAINAPVMSEKGTTPSYLTSKDIRAAFEWAKNKALKNNPLVVIFIGEGLPNELILGPSKTKRKMPFPNPFARQGRKSYLLTSENVLPEEQFNELLESYQTTTGHNVFVVIEANYAGTLIDGLAKPGRVIITSTGEGPSYSDNFGLASFTKFYFEKLREGLHAKDALEPVVSRFKTYGYPFDQQVPQLTEVEGKLAQQFSLIGELPGHVLIILRRENGELVPDNGGTFTMPDQPVDRTIKIDQEESALRGVGVHYVKASVKTPETICQFNHRGHSRQPPESVFLREEANGEWHVLFSNFTTTGKYMITFWAENEQGHFIEAQTTELWVKQGRTMHYSRLDGNRLLMPAVTVLNGKGGIDIYQAQLTRQPNSDGLFGLDSLSNVSETGQICYANYDPLSLRVDIPLLQTSNESGRSAQLRFIPETSLFELIF